MNSENKSNWVPDYLPDFKGKFLPVTVSDQSLATEVKDLAKLLRVDTRKLCIKFIKLGVIAYDTEIDPRTSLVEIDSEGNEDEILLMEQQPPVSQIQSPGINLGFISIRRGRELTFSIPGSIGDIFMEIANRHHTNVDEVIRRMFILGIKMARARINSDRSYFLREEDKEDEEIKF